MILFKKAADLRNYLDAQAIKGNKIGFVPTMGALHDGHISLVGFSKKENDHTVCSIFVNPAQFNDPDDLKKYPVTIEQDIHMLESSGCDILFLPSVDEMYPGGFATGKTFDLGYLESILEGKYRPGHFQGVCRIVDLLLAIVNPHQLYLGQKDYQQCLVIKKLLDLTDRTTIKLIVCPTLREPDGLAMSSRNRRLNNDERSKAPLIFMNLTQIKNDLQAGSLTSLKEKAKLNLEKTGFRVDYIELADANDLRIVKDWDGDQKLVALVAAFLNDIRLIDNIQLN
jgi:pantoate--beta-alanine ligase